MIFIIVDLSGKLKSYKKRRPLGVVNIKEQGGGRYGKAERQWQRHGEEEGSNT